MAKTIMVVDDSASLRQVVGIALEDVASTLEEEGVASFAKSFDELISTLEAKADTLGR